MSSNSSYVLQFASRRFLDTLLTGEDGTRRTNRQLQVGHGKGSNCNSTRNESHYFFLPLS